MESPQILVEKETSPHVFLHGKDTAVLPIPSHKDAKSAPFASLSEEEDERFRIALFGGRKSERFDPKLNGLFERDSRFLRRIPLFILAVSLLETVIYYAADERMKRFLMYDVENEKQVWRFFTYMLLHTNEVHLGLNIAVQGFLGVPLEVEQGRVRCAVIYFGGGLAGSLGTSAFAAFSLMAGASGGVYALLTAQIPHVVLNCGTVKYAVFRILAVSALAASDVAYCLCRAHFFGDNGPRIGWTAHVSGAAAGLLLGFFIFHRSSQWKINFREPSSFLITAALKKFHPPAVSIIDRKRIFRRGG